MPYQLLVNLQEKVLLSRFTGPTLAIDTLDKWDVSVRKLAAKSEPYRCILDFRAIQSAPDVSSGLISARGSRRIVPGVQVVHVSGDSPEIYGLCRMFASYERAQLGEQTVVVKTMEEAYRILGLKEPIFQAIVETEPAARS